MTRLSSSLALPLLLALLLTGSIEAQAAKRARPAAAQAAALRSPLSLWTPAQLAEPGNRMLARDERAIRHLIEPAMPTPARQTPQDALPPLPAQQRGIIRRVALPEGDRRVALTFDLCERSAHITGYDARLVDALRAAKARATFFAGGKWMRSHMERSMQLMADPRFEMANHSWAHANMAVAPKEFRLRQVQWTQAQYELLRDSLDRLLRDKGLAPSGLGPLRLFRLPYGRGGAEVAAQLNDLGLAVIQWDVVGEAGGGNAQARARAIAEAVKPGSIVLLHANAVPKDTAAVVKFLLPLLAKKGYATATVSELLAAGQPETVAEGYFSTPGDNLIYDTMFENFGTGRRKAAGGNAAIHGDDPDSNATADADANTTGAARKGAAGRKARR